MLYSAISELNFFDQFDVDRNVIINELEYDNNKANNLENSTVNIVKNVSSARNNINVKDNRGNIKERVSTDQNKKNCAC